MKKRLTPTQRKLKRIWNFSRTGVVLVLSAVIVYFTVRYSINYVISNYIEPVDKNDAAPIEVVIPSSSSASSIARILYNACGAEEEGLIQNTAVFKVYVDFVGKANSMKAGTYVLSKNMTLEQIVDIICEGNAPKQTVKFTIPEGYTVEDIGRTLLEKGLISDTATLDSVAKTGIGFDNFAFIAERMAHADPGWTYLMEGFLFPDTYEVYRDATVDTILIKMLNRFNEIYSEAYAARAAELNLSMDQVVTLASLIEREAQEDEDFAKVSAVFHNRLNQDMPLQSCASLSYALKENKYTFTEAELATESPYNTYKFKGLPAGPVSNPGKTAIEAALYPNSEFLSEGYLFFCNGNPAVSNALIFAKTYEEHQSNIKEYQQYWK